MNEKKLFGKKIKAYITSRSQEIDNIEDFKYLEYLWKKINSKHINIKSTIPAPGTSNLYKRLEKVESRSMHGQLPIAWNSAKDFYIYDIYGNKFIDFTSTIFVANVGHSNNRIKKYIKKTLDNNFLHSYAYINKIRANYIEKLIKFAGKGFRESIFNVIRNRSN